MESATCAASTAARTAWTRTIEAPFKIAAVIAAKLAFSRRFHWHLNSISVDAVFRQPLSQEGLTAHACQQRTPQRQQFALPCKQRVILTEALSETISRVQHQGFRCNTGRQRPRPDCWPGLSAPCPARHRGQASAGSSTRQGCRACASAPGRLQFRSKRLPYPPSQARPLTSFTISAPACNAARAVAAL